MFGAEIQMTGLRHDRFIDDGARRSMRASRNSAVRKQGARRDVDAASAIPQLRLQPDAIGQLQQRSCAAVGAFILPLHADAAVPAQHGPAPSGDDVVAFSGLIAAREIDAAWATIVALRAQGVALESIYSHLLIPAARLLSDRWDEVLCAYRDSAIGMLHLHQLLRGLRPAYSVEGKCQSRDRRVLLVSAPAEQNMLGVYMVTEFYRCVTSEFFHHAGWEVWRTVPTSRTQLMGVLRSQWFDVIDVSATCEARLPLLSADLAEMRKASRNSRVSVMVGGPAFCDHPEFVARVGADGFVSDLRDTMVEAEVLTALRER